MKTMQAMLTRREAFSEITIGNTAIVRAMMESGIKVVTSYPGSPTPEIAEAIRQLPVEQRPFYFEFSVNEKVAAEVAFGAAIDGRTSCVFFKSVGLNVAADSFVQFPLMDISGGMVVLLGDDPGANSSQNEQDNRHYAELSYMPLYEPASAQEAYDMFKDAVKEARARRSAVIVRMTTHVCHAKEKINFDALPDTVPAAGNPFAPGAEGYIPIAASVFPLKRRALERLNAFAEYADSSVFTHIDNHANAKRGVITAGTAYMSLLDVIASAKTKPDILKLGIPFPLPQKSVLDFLKAHEEVKILEELDPVLEHLIKALAYEHGLSTRIRGKESIDERIGEYVPDKVHDILSALWPDMLEARPKSIQATVGARPPQLCPGCGHRSAFHAIRQALSKEDISVADIGCHTLGFLPPYKMGSVLLSMGHSTSTASGLSLAGGSRKVVCFLGDSTFFHAGLPGIINAVYNKHTVTLIVMENGTTAMTGHQDHPGTGNNFSEVTEKLSIRTVLEALGVQYIREVDTYQQAKLTALVKEALEEPGFKVIIARHPCMLKFTREARRKDGWKARHVFVNPASCTKAHVCISQFGCPSFQFREEGAVEVQDELCIGDGSCRQTCPSSAIDPEGATK